MAMDSKNNSIKGEHVIDLVSSYLDNALEAGEHERVRAHIAACEVCAAELRELQATQRMLRAMPVQVPPRVFTLTEEMVEVRPRAEAAPSLLSRLFGRALAPRLATGSVLAFTLLLVMLVSDLGILSLRLSSGPQGIVTTSSKLAPENEGQDAAAQRNMAVSTTTAEAAGMLPMVAPLAATATAGESDETAGATPGEADQANALPPQSSPVAEAADATATTGSTGEEAPTEVQAANAPTAQDAAADQAFGAGAEGTVVTSQYLQAPPGPEDGESDQAFLAQSPNPGGTFMPVTLLIELALAVLGVGLAVGALLARRKRT